MSSMSRPKRKSTYAVAGVLVLGVAALAFHDAILRWATLRLVRQVPGLEVEFDGRFDVTRAFPLTLAAEGVRLSFDEGAFEGSQSRLGELHLEIRTGPLLRGSVHIERLMIADADIDIPHVPAAKTTGRPTTDIPISFVAALRLDRVNVRFRLDPATNPHELNIANLEVGATESGDLQARSGATFDGDAFELTAALGSVEEFLRPSAPFPVKATLRAPGRNLDARLSGTLAEPLRGRGAELDIRATTSDVSPLRDVFLPHAPFAGAVDASARISGDLHAPALSNLDLTVDDGDRFSLTVGGNVANPTALEGLDLQVEAASADPTVTRYLLGEVLPAAREIRLRAGVRGDAGDFRIEDLSAEISGEKNLSVEASGAIHLSDLESKWPVESADLDLKLTGDVASLNAWLPEGVPETGLVRVNTHIDGAADSLEFSNVALVLDETRPVHGEMRGEIGYGISQLAAIRAHGGLSADTWVPATADLTLDLATADFGSLSTLLGRTLPDLGPVSVKARLRRSGDTVEVTKLDARTSGKRPLSLTTRGRLAIAAITSKPSMRDMDLEVRAKGPDAESVAHLTGPSPIDPGRWSLQARLEKKTENLRVDALQFESGRADTVRVKLDGKISDLENLIASAGKIARRCHPRGPRICGFHEAAREARRLADCRLRPRRRAIRRPRDERRLVASEGIRCRDR